MFEHFTDRARRAVVLAQEEARWFNHNYIGTEHILLGLVHEGEGVAVKALQSLEVSLDVVRRRVEEIIGHGQAPATGHIPFTPRAKKVLEFSKREATQLGHSYIGTEHILLGLLREEEGVACQVLVSLGVDRETVRGAVIELVSGQSMESESAARRRFESVSMTLGDATVSASANSPTCPACRMPLAGHLSSKRLPIEGSTSLLFVVYCTFCGASLETRIEEPKA